MSHSDITHYHLVVIKNKKPEINRALILFLVLFFITVIIMIMNIEEQKNPKHQESLTNIYNPVRFTSIKADRHASFIRTTGEVISRNSIDIKTQLSGEIIYANHDFLPGNFITKGTVICKIQSSLYKYQLTEAKNRFSQAQLAFLIEQQKQIQARQNWKHTGHKNKPTSILVLRQPQLIAAQTELDSAQTAIEHAKYQLDSSIIRAPFDGVVVKGSLNLGEIIETGAILGRILDTKTLDIVVSVTEENWKMLPDNWRKSNIDLYPVTKSSHCCIKRTTSLDVLDKQTTHATSKIISSNTIWSAKIRTVAQYLNQQTRLRNIYLETTNNRLQKNTLPLLPGSFVQVIIPGRKMDNILKIPESAYTRDSKIWIIDDNNRLHYLAVQLYFTDTNFVFVKLENIKNIEYRVVLFPQSSFNIGQKIKPIETLSPVHELIINDI